jgi:hypothetical protein
MHLGVFTLLLSLLPLIPVVPAFSWRSEPEQHHEPINQCKYPPLEEEAYYHNLMKRQVGVCGVRLYRTKH